MSTRQTIAKNAGALLISQLVTWVLAFALTIFLPRFLGSTAMGKLALATSLWAIGTIIVTFGMDTHLTKEIARNHARASDLFGVSFLLRIALHIVVYGVIILYMVLLRYPGDTTIVVCIIGVSSLFWELIGACQATLQGLERMDLMTVANILGKGVNMVMCIALLLLGQGVFAVAIVGILAAIVTLAVELRAVARLIPLRSHINWDSARTLLRASIPYLLSGVFLVAYAQMDIVIISLLVDEKTIGWYGAAGQLFGTLMFVPNVFMTAVFPTLSRMFSQSPDALPRVMRKSFDWMLLISIPIGLGLSVVANSLVVLLFGPDFTQSGPILTLMGIVLILTYLNMLIGQFLTSTDRQNRWTLVMALAMVCTVGLDLVLVPFCRDTFGNGGIGGSLSFIITETGMVVYGIVMLPKGSLGRVNIGTAVRIVAAGLVMAGAAWLVRSMFIAIPVLVGAIVYVVMLFVLRLIPHDDWAMFISIAQGMRNRFMGRRLRAEQGSR